eukprot:c36516_g1_i1 orf=110-1009(+)
MLINVFLPPLPYPFQALCLPPSFHCLHPCAFPLTLIFPALNPNPSLVPHHPYFPALLAHIRPSPGLSQRSPNRLFPYPRPRSSCSFISNRILGSSCTSMASGKEEIVLPVVTKPAEARHGHSPSLTEVHVLAVDDSVLDRKVIERLLRTSSYKVTTVDSGNKALEVLGIEGGLGLQINISLIITDYCMPGMTGYDLLKRVKETSALKEIPVVIMSSENVPNRIQRCLDEGAEEFIMKPVQMADVERLKSHIRSSSQKSCHVECHVDQPGLSCKKRKFGSEGFEVQNSERRPRLSELTVA